jgi:hypothetical protein
MKTNTTTTTTTILPSIKLQGLLRGNVDIL